MEFRGGTAPSLQGVSSGMNVEVFRSAVSRGAEEDYGTSLRVHQRFSARRPLERHVSRTASLDDDDSPRKSNSPPRENYARTLPPRSIDVFDSKLSDRLYGDIHSGSRGEQSALTPHPPSSVPASPSLRNGLRSRSAPYRRVGSKLADTSAAELAGEYIGHRMPETRDSNMEGNSRGSSRPAGIMTPIMFSRSPIRSPPRADAVAVTGRGAVRSFGSDRDAPASDSKVQTARQPASTLQGSFPIRAAAARVTEPPAASLPTRSGKRAAASARLPTSHLRLRQQLDAARPPTRQRNAFPTFLSDVEMLRDIRHATTWDRREREEGNDADAMPAFVRGGRMSPTTEEAEEDVDVSQVVDHLAREGTGRRADFYARELRLQRQHQARNRALAAGILPADRPATNTAMRPSYVVTPNSAEARIASAWSQLGPQTMGFERDIMSSSSTLRSHDLDTKQSLYTDFRGDTAGTSSRMTAATCSTRQANDYPTTADQARAEGDDGFDAIPVSVDVPIHVSRHAPLHAIAENEANSNPRIAHMANWSNFGGTPPQSREGARELMRTLLGNSFHPSFDARAYDAARHAQSASELSPVSPQVSPPQNTFASPLGSQNSRPSESAESRRLELTPTHVDMPDVEDDLFLEETNLDEGFLSLFANGQSILTRSPLVSHRGSPQP